MTRKEIERYILEAYGVAPDYPWLKYPDYAVFRHGDTRKWFAVVMGVDKRKFGIDKLGKVDVMNVKCETILIDSLVSCKGIFPAYHMSKGSWISVWLDGSVPAQQVKWIIDMSYDLTDKKAKA